jgi:hypothetical protein
MPLAYYLKKPNTRLLSILLAISLFNNIVTLQPPEYLLFQPTTIYYKSEYAETMNSFKPLGFPLFTYYFPLTVLYGPRARIIEHLAGGFWNIDIRDYAYYGPRLPPFVNLIPLALILGFIWRQEIFDRGGRSRRSWTANRLKIFFNAAAVLFALVTAYSALMILLHEPTEKDPRVHPILALAVAVLGALVAYILRLAAKACEDTEKYASRPENKNP